MRIILIYNHPCEELKPSAADLDMTDRMIQAGIIVDTEVYDHLIIKPQTKQALSRWSSLGNKNSDDGNYHT